MEEHQPQATTESDESADIEDVKVCDICGDAGQEELLAICSRCTDGAEHTYCMRKKLHELPEGDWLCEECKIKEETENADNSEPILGEQEVLHFNEIASNPRSLQELDTKVLDSGVHVTSEEVAETDLNSIKKVSDSSCVSIAAAISKAKSVLYQELDTKVHGVHGTNEEVDAENDVKSSRKVSDSSDVSIGAAISKAKSVLSRGSSFGFLEARKLKQAQQAASSGGPLSKSVSFNNTNAKPKVKQVIGSIPQNQICGREYVSSDTRKEGVVKSIIESASFKSLSSGCFTAEPINKVQASHSSQPEDHRVLKEEQRKMVEKGSYIVERSLINPPPVTGDSSRPNPETEHRSESNVLQINRRSLDTDIAGSELKKALHISKNIGRTPLTLRVQKPYQTDCTNNVNASSIVADRSCCIPRTVLQRTAPWASDFAHRDNKIKDLPIPNIPKKEASGGSRSLLHCKKCNEVGHTTDHCSIDKLHVFALKPSADRNLKEGNKSSKWKDAVDASSSKFMIQKGIRLPNHSEKSSVNNAELHCGQPSKNFRFDSSSCQDNVRTSVSDPSKPAPAVDVNLQAVQQVEASSRANVSNPTVIASDSQMKVKSPPQILSDEASVLPNISRASVIPELEFIWQGAFEVLRSGRLYKLCDGVQAHLSTSASPKVLEAATKLPCKVQLEEVTRASSWPRQFQGKSPEETNIGLFFFAKDFESYEKNYWKLLEDMIKNDLALKGNIEGAELLVFPSNKLPVNSQRWNKLFFLWGVFRGKSLSCFETVAQFHEKPFGSSLDTSVQDLSTPLSELPVSHKLYSHEKNLDDEIPMSDRSPKVKGVKFSASVDLHPILSSGVQINATQLSNGATSSDTFLKNTDLAGKGEVNFQCYKEMEGTNSLMTGEACGFDKLGGNKIESSRSKKRPLPTSMGTFSRDSDENISSTEVMQLNESISPPVDDRREHKKKKLGGRGILDLNFSEEDNFVPDGRIFFPMDVDFVKNRKSDAVVNVEYLEKDDPPAPKIPNLELELGGGRKECPKEEVSPIRDDTEASLSLSLAFCASKKE